MSLRVRAPGAAVRTPTMAGHQAPLTSPVVVQQPLRRKSRGVSTRLRFEHFSRSADDLRDFADCNGRQAQGGLVHAGQHFHGLQRVIAIRADGRDHYQVT